jgi:transcriptional regulator with XRE-family HTH domain
VRPPPASQCPESGGQAISELYQLSMRQFAELAGISNPYLPQIERGLRWPSDEVVDAVARSLDMSAAHLYRQAGIPLEDEDAPSEAGRAARAIASVSAKPRNRTIRPARTSHKWAT